MGPLLTILIPTLFSREASKKTLVRELNKQIAAINAPVKITIYRNDGIKYKIGKIRQKMIKRCTTKYCVFFDDDDTPGPNYISKIIETLQKYPDIDSVGFIMDVFINGNKDGCARIAHEYNDWFSPPAPSPYKYCRTINHVCPVKTELAIKAGYDDMGHGEDYEYAKRLKQIIQTSVTINDILYIYNFSPRKPATNI